MVKSAKNIIPVHATHPGSILKNELQSRGIKQKDFAKTIGMPAPNLSEIVKGKRHITEAIAIRLEDALGIPFQTWMNLQSRYHYVVKRREEMDNEEREASLEEQSLGSRLNLAVIYKVLKIEESSSLARIKRLKENLSIDLNQLQSMEVNTNGFFKRSERLKIDEVNMRTWLLLAWSEASKVRLAKPYSDENATLAASAISSMANDGTLNISSLKEILNDNGIIFCHVPKLEAAPIDAYSVMIGRSPAIVVTYRNEDMDKLAFDVLHELGHIHLHLGSDKSYISVENDYGTRSQDEREADVFAADCLISPSIWKSIMSAHTEDLSPNAIIKTVANEARKYGISPSVAVSRYKYETTHLSAIK